MVEEWARERGAPFGGPLHMSQTDIHTALLTTVHSDLKKYYVVLPSNNNLNNPFTERTLLL